MRGQPFSTASRCTATLRSRQPRSSPARRGRLTAHLRRSRCNFSGAFPSLRCSSAVCAFADTSGQGVEASWPANVRVNQDHIGNQQGRPLSPGPDTTLHLVTVFWEVISFDPQKSGEPAEAPELGLDPGRRPDLAEPAFRETGSTAAIPHSRRTGRGTLHRDDPVPHFRDQTDVSIGILKSTDGGETFVKTADVGFNRSWTSPI